MHILHDQLFLFITQNSVFNLNYKNHGLEMNWNSWRFLYIKFHNIFFTQYKFTLS